MINEFLLSPSEEKYIRNTANKARKVNTVKIKYYYYNPLDNSTSEWSIYSDFSCLIEEVSELTLKKYSNFSVMETGDVVIQLPSDTSIPKKMSKYKLDYQDKEYICETSILGQEIIGEEGKPLYYVGVFKK